MITLLKLSFVIILSGLVQDVPDAFPREGAKQIINNERVTVYDVVWPKGRPLPMHRHQNDMVGIELADSSVRLTSPDGTTRAASLTLGMAYFQQKGIAHVEEETGDKPRHAVLVDLKDTVVQPLKNTSGYPLAFPREGARKIVDNERVVIWDYTWTVGKPTPMHFHDRDAVVVYMENGQMQSRTPEGQVTPNSISLGDTRFNARDRIHSEELVSGKARAIIVELK